uniref:Uncharacterized protein n=1 Tax=Arundo donax TaxID=35708 RepID=A0A0A9GHU0_ARUDO
MSIKVVCWIKGRCIMDPSILRSHEHQTSLLWAPEKLQELNILTVIELLMKFY